MRKVVVAALLLWSGPAASVEAQQKYVQISAPQVVIRFAPVAAAEPIATARKGDVFRLSAEKGGWLEIYMFSGEGRYIPQASASMLDYNMTMPEPVSRRREIYLALGKAEDRAFADADRKYQPSTVDKNIEYQRILDDRYKLEVMHKFGAQPAIYNRLNIEGAKARWR